MSYDPSFKYHPTIKKNTFFYVKQFPMMNLEYGEEMGHGKNSNIKSNILDSGKVDSFSIL
jgi:hypothetical protein